MTQMGFEEELQNIFARRRNPYATIALPGADSGQTPMWPNGPRLPGQAAVQDPALIVPPATRPRRVNPIQPLPDPVADVTPPLTRPREVDPYAAPSNVYGLSMQERLNQTLAALMGSSATSEIHDTPQFVTAVEQQSPSKWKYAGLAAADANQAARAQGLGPAGQGAATLSGLLFGRGRYKDVAQGLRNREITSTQAQLTQQQQAGLQGQYQQAQLGHLQAETGLLNAQAQRALHPVPDKPGYFEGAIGENDYGVDPSAEVRWKQNADGSAEIVLVGGAGKQKPIVVKAGGAKKGPLTGAKTVADEVGNEIYVDESGNAIPDPKNPSQPLYAKRVKPEAGSPTEEIATLKTELDQHKGQLTENERAISVKGGLWQQKAGKMVTEKQMSMADAMAAVKAEDPSVADGSYDQTVRNTESLRKAITDKEKRLTDLQDEVRKNPSRVAAPSTKGGVTEAQIRAAASAKGLDPDKAVERARKRKLL